MTKEQILKKMEEMVAAIDEAQHSVIAGIVKDLTSMDMEVARLCDAIIKLSPEEAAQVQPAMADMISRLETLEQSLQNFKNNAR